MSIAPKAPESAPETETEEEVAPRLTVASFANDDWTIGTTKGGRVKAEARTEDGVLVLLYLPAKVADALDTLECTIAGDRETETK